MVTAGNTLGLPTPRAYKCTGSCPHCGAPLYVDADIPEQDGHLTALPNIYYTCGCRYNLTPQIVPLPTYQIPYSTPPLTPYTPFWWQPVATGTTTAPPLTSTWRGDNINILDDGHKTICGENSFWDRFCGTVMATQDLKFNVIM